MAYYFCVNGSVNDSGHCIKIPVAFKRKFPWEDSRLELETDWVINEQLNGRVVQDLTVLAAIDQLAQQMSGGTREALNRAIEQIQEQIELPTEFTLQRR